jgi:phosphocarrier protein FPr
VTVRLLDFTNDKMPPFLADRIGSGRLGPSSLSLLLADPDALDAQLAAALSVADTRDLRVLVPMVERADELLTVQRRLASVAERLGVDAPMLGAMIESPEGVDALPTLVEIVDFFSLGTNDLTAATLGVARTDERVGPAQAARPDVLRQIDRAVRVTAAAGRPLSVCGDAAADPAVLPLLLGTGLTTLSVAPSRLDAVRALVRSVDVGNCRTRVAAVLAGGSPTDLVAAGVSRG